MKKVTFYVGLNDKDSKLQQIDSVEAYKIVNNFVLKIFGFGTILHATGVYTHENGEIVTENTLQVEVLNTGIENFDDKVREFCKYCKIALNQESIAVQYQMIASELI